MSGVLSTVFDCNGTRTTWATAREKNPLESLTDFADRHVEEVEEAEESCNDNVISPLSVETTWTSSLGSTTYSSDDSRAQHNQDVSTIQVVIPPA